MRSYDNRRLSPYHSSQHGVLGSIEQVREGAVMFCYLGIRHLDTNELARGCALAMTLNLVVPVAHAEEQGAFVYVHAILHNAEHLASQSNKCVNVPRHLNTWHHSSSV